MSLSQANLAAIQKAGQAIYEASQRVSDALYQQAQTIVTQVASQPFHADSEQAFAQFKALAALNQELQAVETQMRKIYGNATELANPAMDVLGISLHPAGASKTNSAAEDALIKPTLGLTKNPPKKAAPASGAARDKKIDRSPQGLTPNDAKLLAYLRNALQSTQWTALTGIAIANGSGLPLGSVGISLSKLLKLGLVKRGARGLYRRA